MNLYSNLAVTAKRLLTTFGQEVKLRRVTTGNYDPATGTAAETTSDTTLQGALFDFGAGVTTVRGTLVQATDKQLLLEARDGVVPTVNDVILAGVNLDVYQIVSVGEQNPAGTPVLYDLHVRR